MAYLRRSTSLLGQSLLAAALLGPRRKNKDLALTLVYILTAIPANQHHFMS